MNRIVNQIILHCSASPNGRSLFQGSVKSGDLITPAQVIDGWHKKRGFKRANSWRLRQNYNLEALGYHYLIYTNGTIVTGRHMNEIGAHTQGFNSASIGICMVGTDQFTEKQWAALATCVKSLQALYPKATVRGHRDYSPDIDGDGTVEPHEWLKVCPSFSVASWLKNNMTPPIGQVLKEVQP